MQPDEDFLAGLGALGLQDEEDDDFQAGLEALGFKDYGPKGNVPTRLPAPPTTPPDRTGARGRLAGLGLPPERADAALDAPSISRAETVLKSALGAFPSYVASKAATTIPTEGGGYQQVGLQELFARGLSRTPTFPFSPEQGAKLSREQIEEAAKADVLTNLSNEIVKPLALEPEEEDRIFSQLAGQLVAGMAVGKLVPGQLPLEGASRLTRGVLMGLAEMVEETPEDLLELEGLAAIDPAAAATEFLKRKGLQGALAAGMGVAMGGGETPDVSGRLIEAPDRPPRPAVPAAAEAEVARLAPEPQRPTPEPTRAPEAPVSPAEAPRAVESEAPLAPPTPRETPQPTPPAPGGPPRSALDAALEEAVAAVEGKRLPKAVQEKIAALPPVAEDHVRVWRWEGKGAKKAGAAEGKEGGFWFERSPGAYYGKGAKGRYLDLTEAEFQRLQADPNATEVVVDSELQQRSRPIEGEIRPDTGKPPEPVGPPEPPRPTPEPEAEGFRIEEPLSGKTVGRGKVPPKGEAGAKAIEAAAEVLRRRNARGEAKSKSERSLELQDFDRAAQEYAELAKLRSKLDREKPSGSRTKLDIENERAGVVRSMEDAARRRAEAAEAWRKTQGEPPKPKADSEELLQRRARAEYEKGDAEGAKRVQETIESERTGEEYIPGGESRYADAAELKRKAEEGPDLVAEREKQVEQLRQDAMRARDEADRLRRQAQGVLDSRVRRGPGYEERVEKVREEHYRLTGETRRAEEEAAKKMAAWTKATTKPGEPARKPEAVEAEKAVEARRASRPRRVAEEDLKRLQAEEREAYGEHRRLTNLRGEHDITRQAARDEVLRTLKSELGFDKKRPRRGSKAYKEWQTWGRNLETLAERALNTGEIKQEGLSAEAIAKIRAQVEKARQAVESKKALGPQLTSAEDRKKRHADAINRERAARRGIQRGDVFLGRPDRSRGQTPFQTETAYRVEGVDPVTGHIVAEVGTVDSKGNFVPQYRTGSMTASSLGVRYESPEQVTRGGQAFREKAERLRQVAEAAKEAEKLAAAKAEEKSYSDSLLPKETVKVRETTPSQGKTPFSGAEATFRNQMKALQGEVELAIKRHGVKEHTAGKKRLSVDVPEGAPKSVEFQFGKFTAVIRTEFLPEFRDRVKSPGSATTPKKPMGAGTVSLDDLELGEVMPLPKFRKDYDKGAEAFLAALKDAPALRGVETIADLKAAANDIPDGVRTRLSEAFDDMIQGYEGKKIAEGEPKGVPVKGEALEVVTKHAEEMMRRLKSEGGFLDLQDLVKGLGYIKEKGTALASYFRHGRARPTETRAMRQAEDFTLSGVRKKRAEVGLAVRRAAKWIDSVSEDLRNDIGGVIEGVENLSVKGDTPDAARARVLADPKARQVLQDARKAFETGREAVNAWIREGNPTEKEYLKHVDNYLTHLYRRKKQSEYAASRSKLLKNSPNARKRELPTLKDAVAAGFEPVTQDVAYLYRVWAETNWKVATTRRVISELTKLKLDMTSPRSHTRTFKTEELANKYAARVNRKGAYDLSVLPTEGDRYAVEYVMDEPMPAILPAKGRKPEGWVEEKHHVFRKVYAKKGGPGGESVFYEGPVWVHPDIYPSLRQLTDNADFAELGRAKGFINGFEALNSVAKAMQLKLSFFHPFSLTESGLAVFAGKNPLRGVLAVGEFQPTKGQRTKYFSPYREGLRLMDNETFYRDATMHGLTFGEPEAHISRFRRLLRGMEEATRGKLFLGEVTKRIRQFDEKTDRMLWEHYHPGYKAFGYYDLVGKTLQRFPNVDPDLVKRTVADYLNDAFGGQEWQSKFWASPTMERLLRQVFLSPDWTKSNIDILRKPLAAMVGSDDVSRIRRHIGVRYWRNQIMVLMAMTQALQPALYSVLGDEEKGDQPYPWQNERGQKWNIDVTPITRHLFDDEARRYAIPGKQIRELLRWASNPLEEFRAKASPFLREAWTQASDMESLDFEAPWKGKPFWLTIPERGLSVASQFVPFSLRGNNFALTLPMRKGMTGYKARHSYTAALNLYADQSIARAVFEGGTDIPFQAAIEQMGRPKYEENLTSLVLDITEAAQANGVDAKKEFTQALGNVRFRVYSEFWRAVEAEDRKGMEKAAEKVVRLNAGIDGLRRSAKSRGLELEREQVKQVKEVYGMAREERRRYLESLR